MIVEFYGITFDAPNGWQDITASLPDGSPPTMSKASGASAVQFSIAKYRSGEMPNINLGDVKSFTIEFCQRNSIDIKNIFSGSKSGMTYAGVLSEAADKLLSAWYLSNGRDIVFVTYVGISDDVNILADELSEAREIVLSMSF
ncbi:hypothetical protein EN829_011320 [Mesorhizobium sp. M00.F.Ca.ET.186.01.1.1]|nr:hypothetical protein EN848_06875 [bacterium M00.F.Ca.ET.205.01.1.1]TGU53784.1 hypothetical protein EN795_11295 [bacterium M00.F.Ca.ET.152.01.1.1]TGV37282.1 hypothetical protein EN829_011320 [Mesorhizobium sp. M00.F.Ca.ET.186.01.1.1]TGZ41358.1 hypothetical protein EN805_21525 [bacterium M00.F.Ca.ET.162.01.1.1]